MSRRFHAVWLRTESRVPPDDFKAAVEQAMQDSGFLSRLEKLLKTTIVTGEEES